MNESGKDKETPLYFSVSPFKLVVMSVVTGGAYELYWIYKNWKLIKQHQKPRIIPVLRTFFAVIFLFSLFDTVGKSAKSLGISYNPGVFILCAVSWWAIISAWKAPPPYDFITYLSVLFLIPIQIVVNKINNTICPDCDQNNSFSIWNIMGIIVGCGLSILVLTDRFFPDLLSDVEVQDESPFEPEVGDESVEAEAVRI